MGTNGMRNVEIVKSFFVDICGMRRTVRKKLAYFSILISSIIPIFYRVNSLYGLGVDEEILITIFKWTSIYRVGDIFLVFGLLVLLTEYKTKYAKQVALIIIISNTIFKAIMLFPPLTSMMFQVDYFYEISVVALHMMYVMGFVTIYKYSAKKALLPYSLIFTAITIIVFAEAVLVIFHWTRDKLNFITHCLIALISIVNIFTNDEIVETEIKVPIDFKYCRRCGAYREPTYKACTKCGFDFWNGHSYCQECGAKTEYEQRICIKCKTELISQPIMRHNVPVSKELAASILFYKLLFLFILSIIIMWIIEF